MLLRSWIAAVCVASLLGAGAEPTKAQPFTPGDAERLQQAIRDYEDLASDEAWPILPGTVRLQIGSTGPRVAILRRRLELSRDLRSSVVDRMMHGNDDAKPFDAELEAAVRGFQRRHGLKADGVVGARTRAALNMSAKMRLDQLRMNLAQAQQSPSAASGRTIVVNIPDYTLRVYDQGQRALDMRVIIGTEYNPTPAFSDTMTYVVFRPYWNIPESITQEETLPEIRRDQRVVQKKGIEVYVPDGDSVRVVSPRNVNWSRFDPAYRLRQRPGPLNPLGLVKFMLPNQHNVYLHDTPSDAHFNATERTLSHGCVRLEKPLELAEFVLQGKPEWNRARIQEAMRNGDNQVVGLAQPIPVHIVYRTAWVESDGTVAFRDDVYGLDVRARAD